MELSIIITVYNTDIDVFKRCLESIYNCNNICSNIIVVDDGSLEKNSTEYEKITKSYKNIEYYKKENAGVSAARNYGLAKSKGKYVMFIDSDDVVFLEKMDSNLLNEEYDVIYFNYLMINGEDNIYENKELNINKSCTINNIDIIKKFIEYDKFYSPWNKIFRKHFLEKNEIKFNTKMINGEDAVFNLNVLLSNPKMYYCNESIYGYYNTISNSYIT